MANTEKHYRRNYGKKDNFRLGKTETKGFWEISSSIANLGRVFSSRINLIPSQVIMASASFRKKGSIFTIMMDSKVICDPGNTPGKPMLLIR
ncbi:hypothetical protein H5410_022803 [Solanum commersonii]|uniref:Uncharacterized protein n=1 Tax=Solanum commersonii TaxID=4109 RepID=A0A9J5ZFS1_SOLCO|nr:hypothetical protein H5410_022803 [Solanum commersonii]